MGYDDLRDQAQKSKQRLEEGFPESWQPQSEDHDHPEIVVGKLVEINFDAPTSYGSASVLIIEDEDGKEWSVWLLHRILKEQVFKYNPRIGDLIAVTYGGEREGKNDNYHVYTVNIERQDEADGNDNFQKLVNNYTGSSEGPEVEWSDGEGELQPDDELPF